MLLCLSFCRDVNDFIENIEESFEIDSETEEDADITDSAARVVRSTSDYNRYDKYDKKHGKNPHDPYKLTLRAVPAGYCDCCVPVICKPPQEFDYDNCKCVCPKKKCLPGHKFNPKTCKCECPEGSIMDKKRMKCIGM